MELADLFSFAHHRAVAGRGIKRGDARAARAEALRKSALRIEFRLELSFEHELFEKLVLTDVSRNHFFHLPRLQQQANAEIVHAGIVRGDGRSEERRVGKECRSRWSPYH